MMDGRKEKPETDKKAPCEKPEKEVKRRERKEDKIKKLLEAKTQEAEKNYQRFLRACAELENYKKRAEKEKLDIIKYSNEELIRELVSILDNLERAIHHSSETDNSESLKEGVKLTFEELLKTLKRFGLEQVSTLGERFDPGKHEAVAVVESSEHEDGTIIKEFQKAYFLKERLLRPAMVSVSRVPNKEEKVKAQGE